MIKYSLGNMKKLGPNFQDIFDVLFGSRSFKDFVIFAEPPAD